MRKITIVDKPMPKTKNVEVITNWLLESLGIITRENHGDIYTKLFIIFLEKADEENPVTIHEVMNKLNLPQSTAYKYVARLIDSGLLTKTGMNEYRLKDGSLQKIVQRIRKNVDEILDIVEERAKTLEDETSFV